MNALLLMMYLKIVSVRMAMAQMRINRLHLAEIDLTGAQALRMSRRFDVLYTKRLQITKRLGRV